MSHLRSKMTPLHRSTEMPKTGQFVAIWGFSGRVFSRTCRIIDTLPGLIEYYEPSCDDWLDVPTGEIESRGDVTYLTLKEE